MSTSNSMVQTLARRLAAHAPFDRLSPEILSETAARLKIRYVTPGEVIFTQGDAARDEVFLVQKGQIAIRRDVEGESVLVDRCDEGDLFGVRAVLAGRAYAAQAVAEQDSLLYVITKDQLETLLRKAPEVAVFLASDFASDVPVPRDDRLKSLSEARQNLNSGRATVDPSLRAVAPSRDLVLCGPDASIRYAAQHMATRNVGSIVIVNQAGYPIGIVTDADLRTKVVAPGKDVNAPIAEIMSSPVVTVERDASEANLIAIMVRRRLHHFAVTEDGTDRSPVVGVISEHDILKTRGNHPTVILNELARAQSGSDLRILRDQTEDLLRGYLETETAMHLVARVVSEINDAIIRRSVELSTAQLERKGKPCPAPFCWLALGSEGREEQLLRTDQDNAMVWDETRLTSGTDPADAASYYLELGGLVVEHLVEAGFARCPGNVMASNPEWNLSMQQWRRTFGSWIAAPSSQATMRSNIAFDFRPVAGDFELARELKQFVLREVKEDRAFLTFFAKAATKSPPPLSFFRNEIVEKSGEHRSTFDIKARAMNPIADGARVMVYDLGIDFFGSTAERWRKVGQTEPNVQRLASEAALAYEILMRTRALEGLRSGSSGRYVPIERLNKLERQTLRSTFLVVEDVQRMLTSRFRLEMMR